MAGFMKLQVWKEEMVQILVTAEDGVEELQDAKKSELAPGTKYAGQGNAWFARYSAPGYMDCTDEMGPCGSAIDAAYEAFRTYGVDERGSEDRKELASVIREIRKAH